MPGVGKVVGTLGSPNVGKTMNMVVLQPQNSVLNNNMKRPPVNPASKEVSLGGLGPPRGRQMNATEDEKWRCKVCKFANPTYVEETDEEGVTK